MAAEILGCRSGQLRKSVLTVTPLACPHSCACLLKRSCAAGMKYVASSMESEVPLSETGAAPAQRTGPVAAPSAASPKAPAPAAPMKARRETRGSLFRGDRAHRDRLD